MSDEEKIQFEELQQGEPIILFDVRNEKYYTAKIHTAICPLCRDKRTKTIFYSKIPEDVIRDSSMIHVTNGYETFVTRKKEFKHFRVPVSLIDLLKFDRENVKKVIYHKTCGTYTYAIAYDVEEPPKIERIVRSVCWDCCKSNIENSKSYVLGNLLIAKVNNDILTEVYNKITRRGEKMRKFFNHIFMADGDLIEVSQFRNFCAFESTLDVTVTSADHERLELRYDPFEGLRPVRYVCYHLTTTIAD